MRTDWHMDRHDEANSRFSQSCERLQMAYDMVYIFFIFDFSSFQIYDQMPNCHES